MKVAWSGLPPRDMVKAPRVSRGGQARRNDDGLGSPAGEMS
jgi:hypothetical protein